MLASALLAISCKEKIIADVEEHSEPVIKTSPAYVPIDYDKAEVVICDTLNGRYAIKDQDNESEIKAGSVVMVKDDNDHYNVVLVTSASRDGNLTNFTGRLGDLRYVFHDTEFTLKMSSSEISGSADNVYYPEGECGATKAEKKWTIWDEPVRVDTVLWRYDNVGIGKGLEEFKDKIPGWYEHSKHASLTARAVRAACGIGREAQVRSGDPGLD